MDIEQVTGLVQNIGAKNMIDAQGTFNDILAAKAAEALNLRRQEVAASVYGGNPLSAAAPDSDVESPEDDDEDQIPVGTDGADVGNENQDEDGDNQPADIPGE